MTDRPTDFDELRTELRALRRGGLLIIAERAAELVSREKLKALLGDFVHVDALAEANSPPATLLADVQKFHSASLAGRYFEAFTVNSGNFMERSKGTDAFVAEFDRLLRQCVCAADTEPPNTVRQAFELLFGLLRHIDEAHDDVLFFADEGSSSEVGVWWRAVFPAYFRCVAQTASAGEFSATVDQAIRDFAEADRPLHLKTALSVASAEQQAALDTLHAASRLLGK